MATPGAAAPYIGRTLARRLLLVALAAFGFGVVIFASRRQWLPLDLRALPGRDWLPSLIHTYVLALVACALLARSRAEALALALACTGLDMALEGLQSASLHAAWNTPAWLRRWLVSTFDPADLAASAAGLLAAGATLAFGRWRQAVAACRACRPPPTRAT